MFSLKTENYSDSNFAIIGATAWYHYENLSFLSRDYKVCIMTILVWGSGIFENKKCSVEYRPDCEQNEC